MFRRAPEIGLDGPLPAWRACMETWSARSGLILGSCLDCEYLQLRGGKAHCWVKVLQFLRNICFDEVVGEPGELTELEVNCC